jgi:cyclic pyranopterin phosphate synthase
MTELALRLSITDRCNLRCVYCSPPGNGRLCPPRDLLSFEEIERAVGLLTRCGVKKVRITGGEPLIRRGVEVLLRRLARHREVSWTLTTNGQRLAEMAPTLREAGFERVNISLDSLDPARFREVTGGGELARTLSGSELAQQVGLTPIKWNVVVMRDLNVEEVASFAEATILRPIHIRFIEYMPTRGLEESWRTRFVSSDETLDRIRRHHRLEPCVREPHSPARLFRLPGAMGRIGVISPVSRPFCADCNRLRLSSRGFLYLCLSRTDGLDLRSLFRRGASDSDILFAIREVIVNKRRLLHPPAEGIRPAEGMATVGG